jgi:hypothetical protein
MPSLESIDQKVLLSNVAGGLYSALDEARAEQEANHQGRICAQSLVVEFPCME